MTGPDRRRARRTQDSRPEAPSPESLKKSEEKPTRDGDGKKNPVFRFTRLDGRDTLKYEDTADK